MNIAKKAFLMLVAAFCLTGFSRNLYAAGEVEVKQKFLIINNSGCNVPGGFVEVISSTQTLIHKPYGDLHDGTSRTIMNQRTYLGDILNRNQYSQLLCSSEITKVGTTQVITYTHMSPCPTKEQNILRPCT